MSVPRTVRRRVLALGATGVVALGLAAGGLSVASADSGSPPSGGSERPALTDTQKACLESHGVTKPAASTKPTAEQRAAVEAAAQACGVTLPTPHGPGGPSGRLGNRPQLTDTQKACLEAQGVTKPAKPADGAKPTPPTAAERATRQAAAAACGITLPTPPTGATNT